MYMYILFFIAVVLIGMLLFRILQIRVRKRRRSLASASLPDGVRLKFSKELPFEPSPDEVIFVEKEFDAFLNDIIRKHLGDLKGEFRNHAVDFVYLPDVAERLSTPEVVAYRNPDWVPEVVVRPETDNGCLWKFVSGKVPDAPGLIHFEGEDEDGFSFSFVPFGTRDWNGICNGVDVCFRHLSADDGIRFRTTEKDDKGVEAIFFTETEVLMKEIDARVKLLRQRGISVMVLKSIKNPTDKLSRIRITKDNRIFLPDYNDMEITMGPLPKAVYFLFLRHPEGILFKSLPDYRDELMSIYKRITNRDNIPDIESSITSLTDPLQNSINEKCARIKESFVTKFDDCLARHYYVHGWRGAPKKINLPEGMIEWE